MAFNTSLGFSHDNYVLHGCEGTSKKGPHEEQVTLTFSTRANTVFKNKEGKNVSAREGNYVSASDTTIAFATKKSDGTIQVKFGDIARSPTPVLGRFIKIEYEKFV
jgi:hypothetical protein